MKNKNIKKLKQKGFSLIEILAAVTILGILATISIVAVNKVIQNGKEQHYNTAEDQLLLAGQNYAQQNRSVLPKAIGQKTRIKLSTLIAKNYIEPIKDYSDHPCDTDASYVQIYKYSQTDYSYMANLVCPQYTTKKSSTTYEPTISLELSESEKTSIAQAKIKITDNKKLMSYSYIVYKNNKEVKNSGSIEVKNYETEINETIKLNEYTPGTIKVVVTATNIYGNTKKSTKEKVFEDKQAPVCVIKDEDTAAKDWTKVNRKITVGCEDGDGSGCTRTEYSKTFTTSTEMGTITIEDEAGNKTDCQVSVYVDKTPPEVTVNVYKATESGNKTGEIIKTQTIKNRTSGTIDLSTLSSTGWLNGTDFPNGVYIDVLFKDNAKLKSYALEWSSGQLGHPNLDQTSNNALEGKVPWQSGKNKREKLIITVKDFVGYTTQVTVNIPLDQEPPTEPTITMYKSGDTTRTYTDNTWTNENVTITASGSTDSLSGFKSYQYTTTGVTTNVTNKIGDTHTISTEGKSYIQFKACDVAGNCSTSAKQTIKIDKTKPTLPDDFSITSIGAIQYAKDDESITYPTTTKNFKCTSNTVCSATVCLTQADVNTTVALRINNTNTTPFSLIYNNYTDTLSGIHSSGRSESCYDNNGNSIACPDSLNSDQKITYQDRYSIRDGAGNSDSSVIIEVKYGQIDSNDGTGC